VGRPKGLRYEWPPRTAGENAAEGTQYFTLNSRNNGEMIQPGSTDAIAAKWKQPSTSLMARRTADGAIPPRQPASSIRSNCGSVDAEW